MNQLLKTKKWPANVSRAAISCWLVFFLSLVSFTILAQTPVIDPAGTPKDWEGVNLNAFANDVANAQGNTDDQFTQGSKDGNALSKNHHNSGSANDKGDIDNAGAFLQGCILYVFADRTAINGDAAIGFWAFRSPVSLNPNGSFNGTHTNGDLLLLSHFTNGGGVSTIEVYEWQNGNLVFKGNSGARVNSAVYPASGESWGLDWTYKSKFGPQDQYPVGAFFEGSVDLCELLGLEEGVCFASFMAETRNSQELKASLQDLALGNFETDLERPEVAVTEPTLCSDGTASVQIINPVVGYTYHLSQDEGGIEPVSILYEGPDDLIFTGLIPGKKFYVYYSNEAGCASDETNCDNYLEAITSGIKRSSTANTITTDIQISSLKKVMATPNPFGDKIKFTLQSDVSGQGSLELYNVLGQKVKTVYQGYIEAGRVQNVEYSVPKTLRSNLIYIFRVGNQKATGKLISQ